MLGGLLLGRLDSKPPTQAPRPQGGIARGTQKKLHGFVEHAWLDLLFGDER